MSEPAEKTLEPATAAPDAEPPRMVSALWPLLFLFVIPLAILILYGLLS